jgi:phosphoheptose isomerase
MRVVALTGAAGPANELAALADVAISAPATATAEVQGWHVRIYHRLCDLIESELFPG